MCARDGGMFQELAMWAPRGMPSSTGPGEREGKASSVALPKAARKAHGGSQIRVRRMRNLPCPLLSPPCCDGRYTAGREGVGGKGGGCGEVARKKR